jgi:hypothetical protein
MCSTNLWPNNIKWSELQVAAINQELRKKEGVRSSSKKAIVWRSIDELSQPQLVETLSLMPECLLIASRVVSWIDYGADKQVFSRKRDLKRDIKLFREKCGFDVISQECVEGGEKSVYEMVTVDSDTLTLDMAIRLVSLYEELYLDKYSRRNPQCTSKGFMRMVKSGFLNLEILRMRSDPETVVAFAAWWHLDSVTTAPFVGYEMAGDSSLYRLTMTLLVHITKKTGMLKQHMSGGANGFKRNRGGISTVEYMAVFTDHLPMYQRWGWKLLGKLANKIITKERAT